MSSKYPILVPKEIIKALSKIGFKKVSQKGSHAKYKNDTIPHRIIIIPMYSEIA